MGIETCWGRNSNPTFLNLLVRRGNERQEIEDIFKAGRNPLLAIMVDVYKIWKPSGEIEVAKSYSTVAEPERISDQVRSSVKQSLSHNTHCQCR
jgi:hypothetical protein